MSWLWFIVQHRIGRRWRDCVIAAALIGLLMGAALFALAGARRTQSSYDHYLRSVDSSDISISQDGFDPARNNEVARSAGVISARTYLGMQVVVVVDGVPDMTQFSEGVASYDGAFFDHDRFVASRGRVPDQRNANEIAFDDIAAQRYGYHIGQQLDIGIVSVAALDGSAPTIEHPTHVTVVGIGAFPDQIIEDDADRTPRMLLTPAFTATALDGAFYNLQYLQLGDVDTNAETIRQHLATYTDPGSVDIHYISVDRASARRGLRPLSITLAVLGVIAAGVATVIGAMALARLLRRDASDNDLVVALGGSPRGVRVASVVLPAMAIVGAAATAVIVAIVGSPLMPLGPAGSFDGSGGVDIDVAVIGLGVIAMIVAAAIAGAVVISRPTTHTRDRTHPRHSRVLNRAVLASSSPTFTTGLRMSFEGSRQSRRVPMRSVIAGTAIAVAMLVVALGFASNVRSLTHDPRLYGWNWDVALRAGQGFGQLDAEQSASILDGDTDIEHWSAAAVGDDLINGVDVPLFGMSPSADVHPSLLSGRFLAQTDEIVLGAATADALDAHIGDVVRIGAIASPRALRIVGIATLPSIGGQHVLHPSLGLGAIVAPEHVPGVVNGLPGSPGPSLAFIRFRDGADPAAVQRLVASPRRWPQTKDSMCSPLNARQRSSVPRRSETHHCSWPSSWQPSPPQRSPSHSLHRSAGAATTSPCCEHSASATNS
ncbi:MAG: hypothetical protein JWN62_3333 [Acidimicrobiales bacterium]|nr:hypothetical protein [Acidimicrobiales bacterium]